MTDMFLKCAKKSVRSIKKVMLVQSLDFNLGKVLFISTF